MKINTLLISLVFFLWTENAFCQKKKTDFTSKNRVQMGYSILFPPIEWSTHGANIFDRKPFHGINLGYERKIFNHFSVNFLTHFTFGEQNGTSYNHARVFGTGHIQTTRFRQIDLNCKYYFSKNMRGFFVGTGAALLRGNLFSSVRELYIRKERNADLLLGFSQTITKKWYVQAQAASSIWGGYTDIDDWNDFIKWNRHTISLQTGLAF